MRNRLSNAGLTIRKPSDIFTCFCLLRCEKTRIYVAGENRSNHHLIQHVLILIRTWNGTHRDHTILGPNLDFPRTKTCLRISDSETYWYNGEVEFCWLPWWVSCLFKFLAFFFPLKPLLGKKNATSSKVKRQAKLDDSLALWRIEFGSSSHVSWLLLSELEDFPAEKKHFSKAGKDMIYVFFLQRFDPWWFSVFVFGKKDTSINKKEISGKDKNIKGQMGLQ